MQWAAVLCILVGRPYMWEPAARMKDLWPPIPSDESPPAPVRRRVPFDTVCLPLSYSGNPGVNGVSHRGVHGKRLPAVGVAREELEGRMKQVRHVAGAAEDGVVGAGADAVVLAAGDGDKDTIASAADAAACPPLL